MYSAHQPPILLYHRVINNASAIGRHKIYVKEKRFRKQMQWLKDSGYQTITFRDLASTTFPKEGPVQDSMLAEAETRNGKLSPLKGGRAIILTFDDGYTDNYTILFPILKEFGFKAVIFLVTSCRKNDWGIEGGEPPVDLMTIDQLKKMDAYGIEFGGHTQHHINLKKSSIEIQRKEIIGCFKDLEQLFGKKPVSFSYPYGAYNDGTIKIVQETGFNFGITTIFGPMERMLDQWRIRRSEVRPHTTMMSFRGKLRGE